MAYQLSDLISSVKTRAKDTALSDSLITDFLNDVQREVLGHRKYTFMETRSQQTLTSGASELTLPSVAQIIEYLAFEINDIDYPVQYVPHRTFYEYGGVIDSPSQPGYFTSYGGTVVFNVPANHDYTVKLHYVAMPATLVNSTDVPDIPEDCREILIRGALARVEEYRENFDIAGLHQRKVEELTEDMNLRYGLRQLITAPKQTNKGFRRASF